VNTPPPDLATEDIADALRCAWDLPATELHHAPVGFGSHHWRAGDAGGERWFVTVDDLDRKPWLGSEREEVFDGLRASLAIALALRVEAGLGFVVAPVPSRSRAPLRRLSARYALSVFPLLDGVSGSWAETPDANDRRERAAVLADLHLATNRVAVRPKAAAVGVAGRQAFEAALDALNEPWRGGPFAEPARLSLAEAADSVRGMLAEFDARAAAATTDQGSWVLTHGEPHPGNLLRAAGRLVLVDWDTAALAPPERDLWHLGEGADDALEAYSERTGHRVDPALLDLYRLAWRLADLADFTATLRAAHTRTTDSEKTFHFLLRNLGA
jgi:spectinomycin phosphotransferase